MSAKMIEMVEAILTKAPSLDSALFMAFKGQAPSEWRLASQSGDFPAYLVAPAPPPRGVDATMAVEPLPPMSVCDVPIPLTPETWTPTPVDGYDEAVEMAGLARINPVAFALIVLGTPTGDRRLYLVLDCGTPDSLSVRILMLRHRMGVFEWEFGNSFERPPQVLVDFFVQRVVPEGKYDYFPFKFGDLAGLLKVIEETR